MDLDLERDVAFMNCKCCGPVVLPTSLFLCALDKMQTKFYTHLLWILSDACEKYPGKSIFDRGSSIYKELTSLRKKLGNQFYKVMNTWEPLVCGWTILHNGDVGKRELYESQIATHAKITAETGVQIPHSYLLPQSDSHEDIAMTLELVGLCKAFGYPILTGDTLFDKLKEFGVEENMEFDDAIIERVHAVMIRDLILNYYKKHRKHLSLKICPPDLCRYILEGKPIPASFNTRYDIWKEVVFDKNFEYDYTPDQTELLRDSALCLPLRYWSQQYDSCMYQILYNKPPPPRFREKHKANTRTINAFLLKIIWFSLALGF